jgi:hypothetical protein
MVRMGACTLVLLVLVSCRANRIDVLLECPSPDRAVSAVLWMEAGGGAAGWTQHLISIQPTSASSDAIDQRSGEDSPIFAINRGEAYRLKWESNDRLVVEVDYPAMAAIFSMRRDQMLLGRKISIMYQQRQVEEHPYSWPQTRCQSDSTTLVDPPPKRIR